MEVPVVGQYHAVQNRHLPQKAVTLPQAEAQKAVSAGRDTVSLSGGAKYLKGLQEQFPTVEDAGGESAKSGGCVGINAAKLARMLAAAKTRAQVQAVMAKIRADLRECDAGKEQGLDVDEASVSAAEHLLQEAKSRLGSAENREATPEEELASALASLL